MKWMSLLAVFIFLVKFSFALTLYPELSGQELINQLRADYKPVSVLGYDTARDKMFGEIDNDNDYVSCVYTGYTIYINPSADPSTDAFFQDMNTEHTWPQSMGADVGNANSDLHHLYPTRMHVNSSRGNNPFKDIIDSATDTWWRIDYSQSNIPASSIDEYSEKDNSGYFEPREDHKGNVARSMFYFYTMYKEQSDTNFFNGQIEILRHWNLLDDVDQDELDRSQKVALFQSNKENPFVLDTTLVRRAYFSRSSSEGGDTTVTGNSGDLIITEIMQNPSVVNDSDGEWFEIYNTTETAIDLNGWYIKDNDTDEHYITYGGALSIEAHSYLVLGRNANTATNGNVQIAYQYSGVDLANGADEIVLVAADGVTEITRVEYDGGPSWPDPTGASMYFTGQAKDATNDHTNWDISQLPWGGSTGDTGSPGSGDIISGISKVTQMIPANFMLQNYPNPFNPTTAISYRFSAISEVSLIVYNTLGQKVRTLVNQSQEAGMHTVTFDASELANGVYFYKLSTGSFVQVRKMVLMK